MRLKISRKKAKETRYWLRLLDPGADTGLCSERDSLIQESDELLKIFSAIINKS